MDIACSRERYQPIFIGSEPVNGSMVDFWLNEGRRLSFRTATPVLAFGIRVEARGTVLLARGYEVKNVELELAPPAGSDRRKSPFNEGNRDRALSEAVSHSIGAAAGRLIERSMDHVARAWLDLADDNVLSRMSYRQSCVDKLAELGDAVSWKDRQFYGEQIEKCERETASLDEEAYASAWMHSTRPGYVVVCDGKMADRGEQRFKEDRGTGWVQRYVCIHFGEAQRFARDLGRDAEDIRVERIRIVEGRPYVVVAQGFVEPEWSLWEPVLTGTLMAGPQ